jgi:hypothetical protein
MHVIARNEAISHAESIVSAVASFLAMTYFVFTSLLNIKKPGNIIARFIMRSSRRKPNNKSPQFTAFIRNKN